MSVLVCFGIFEWKLELNELSLMKTVYSVLLQSETVWSEKGLLSLKVQLMQNVEEVAVVVVPLDEAVWLMYQH